MFSLFGLDKVAAQIIGIIILIVVLTGGYFWWKHSVKQEALLEWNKNQQEQVVKEQKELIEDLTEVAQTQKVILDEVRKRNDFLEKRFSELEIYLNRPDTVKKYKNTQSSDVLKRTFKELNK